MSTELYGLVQSKITTDDIQAFKAQAKKMKDATENEIGTISYDFFINEEKREVFIVEKYADDKAFMTHMEQFLQEEFIPKILTMMELTSLKMLGPVTEEIDDFFAKGGWTYDAYPLAMQELVFSIGVSSPVRITITYTPHSNLYLSGTITKSSKGVYIGCCNYFSLCCASTGN